jgi:hypothetical protein
MVKVSLDSQGLIRPYIVPRGASINTTYTAKVLGNFMEHLNKKRPAIPQQQ